MFPVSLNSKVNIKVFHKQTIYKSQNVGNTTCRDTKKFLLPCFVLRKSLWHRLCPPLTSQCCTYPKASAGCQRSAPMTWAKTWDMTTCWDFYPMQLLKEATWRRICLHLLSRWMYWLICESSRWPNDRVGVVFILAVFNDTVVKILAHDKGCETPLSLLDS